tara:strand:+ start:480 stop:1142 length:663 start_codon:yes stop_codon:yes gene_type:complete
MGKDIGTELEAGSSLTSGDLSESDNILEFPQPVSFRYDPLKDPDVLDLLRSWFRAGDAVIFPADVECYRRHHEAVDGLSDKEAGELGLKVPCHMIRSPATEASQKVDSFRYRLGAWEMRVTNIIVGAWLFDRQVDQALLERLMPDSNFAKMIPKLVDGGLVRISSDGDILPSRILLYRAVEQVVWLFDTMAPLIKRFSGPIFADKMAHWPPFDEEAPSCR